MNIIQLLKAKCLPCLYYGLEACPLNKSQIKTLEYTLNSAFKKIFMLNSYDIAHECVILFNCSVSDAVCRKKVKFLTKLLHSGNIVCLLFADSINRELANLAANLT